METKRIVQILEECLGNEGEPGVEVVDVWIAITMKVDKVKQHEHEMQMLLQDWPQMDFGQPVPPLGHELSYIQVGAILGDQQLAFLLFAYGKLLGWWKVMTPTSMLGLPKDDAMAQDMAGMGFVAISGYTPAGVMP
jgi:hypothetical protein